MKTWDVIIVGGGVIGLSLAIALRKRAATVLVVERGEPGREASHAAGGMLVDCPIETPPVLQRLASASARLYPQFAHEVETESGLRVDLRDQGTIMFLSAEHAARHAEFAAAHALPKPLQELEAQMVPAQLPAAYLQERSVDPRALGAACWKAAKNLGVDFSTGDPVESILINEGKAIGVCAKTTYHAAKVVNCAGAWSGRIPGGEVASKPLPVRPVKGQMLCLAMPSREFVKHVVRSPEVYLIPRSDGRLLVGATVEDAGYDKRTDPVIIQQLHRAALALVPGLSDARILEDWAGLRPGTPDGLPILGATETPGYYVATGHFRDGILLAPITAQVMTEVIEGREPELDLSAFSPGRF